MSSNQQDNAKQTLELLYKELQSLKSENETLEKEKKDYEDVKKSKVFKDTMKLDFMFKGSHIFGPDRRNPLNDEWKYNLSESLKAIIVHLQKITAENILRESTQQQTIPQSDQSTTAQQQQHPSTTQQQYQSSTQQQHQSSNQQQFSRELVQYMLQMQQNPQLLNVVRSENPQLYAQYIQFQNQFHQNQQS